MLRWTFLVPILVAVVAKEDNFLYKGCSATTYIDDILVDSMNIHLKYPPQDGFTISLRQGGNDYSMSYQNPDRKTPGKQWMAMKLSLEGTLELQFMNGTTFLSDVGGGIVEPVPEKKLSFNKGFILPNCPQELPNWKVQRHQTPSDMLLNEGDEVVFSLFLNNETLMTLNIGDEELVLCWSTSKDTMMVFASSGDNCDKLPPFRVLWLKVSYKENSVVMSDPSKISSAALRTFSAGGDELKLTFPNDVIDGIAYVVHHLQGFPQPPQEEEEVQEQHPSVLASSSNHTPPGMCELVSISVGVAVFLIIIILCLLCALFYTRWINTRQILFLLRSHDQPKLKGANNLGGEDYGRKPSLPSNRAPGIKDPNENSYLTPRELKKLVNDDDGMKKDRPESEHIYEDMVYTGWPSKKQQNKDSSTPVGNQGFVKPENEYEVRMK